METAKKKVIVLGSTGMLGSMMVKTLKSNPLIDLSVSVSDLHGGSAYSVIDGIPTYKINATWPLSCALPSFDYIINCIASHKGMLRELAGHIDAVFPNQLASHCPDSKIIHISTDAVFDTDGGKNNEKSRVSPSDFYGSCKVVGENDDENVSNIRCSIVGPEVKTHKSLLDWFLAQPKVVPIKGYSNHFWNGITTLALSKIISGIIANGVKLPNIVHVVPSDSLSKFDLLQLFNTIYEKQLDIIPSRANHGVNRVLTTVRPELNQQLWELGGYSQIPTIKELILELHQYAKV